jgi:hypothetical protein
MMPDVFNPLADGDDDPFAEVLDDPGAVSIYVVDVARMEERRALIYAMQAEHRKVAAWLMSHGIERDRAIEIGMGVVLYGLDWVAAPLPTAVPPGRDRNV